jgi:hypothetical protein
MAVAVTPLGHTAELAQEATLPEAGQVWLRAQRISAGRLT